ncbi:MAG: hypothetical protein OXF84_14625 [Bacteroidetes bacterium]|nr:hypothetical protein [Bacteroidota bacterium]
MNERIDALEEEVLAEIRGTQELLDGINQHIEGIIQLLDGMIQRLERINNMLRWLIGLAASAAICTVAIHVLM